MINNNYYKLEVFVGDKSLPRFTSPNGGNFIIGIPSVEFKLQITGKKSGLLIVTIDGKNIIHRDSFTYKNIKGIPCRHDEQMNITYWVTDNREPLVFSKAGSGRRKNPALGTIGVGFIPSLNENDDIIRPVNNLKPVIETSIVYDTPVNLRIWGVYMPIKMPPIPHAFPIRDDIPSWVKQ